MVYETLQRLAKTHEDLREQSAQSAQSAQPAPALRLHVYSETDALRPTSEGTFVETGPRLRFHATPTEHSTDPSTGTISTGTTSAESVVYHASLDGAGRETPLGDIRVVLNSEPLASIDCMREADALVLTSASSFSKNGYNYNYLFIYRASHCNCQLSDQPSIHLSIYPSIGPSTHPSIHLTDRPTDPLPTR